MKKRKPGRPPKVARPEPKIVVASPPAQAWDYTDLLNFVLKLIERKMAMEMPRLSVRTLWNQ